MTEKEKPNGVKWETIWKIALGLLGYLVMGVWITGQLAADNRAVKADMQELKQEVKSDIRDVKQDVRALSNRVDSLIDNHKD